MASPNSTFTEIVTTTLRKHRAQIFDNVSNNNALLRRMRDKGDPRVEDGGYTIVANLDYAENSTYQRYSGYDVLDISASDVLSAAEYQWRQIAVNVVASGEELRKNSGSSRIANLVKARLTNALRTFKNNFSSDIYSDGTLTNQINGLQALISDSGTGTVGGVDSSAWTFWQNKVQSAASPLQGGGAITPSETTIESLMLPLWLRLSRGDDKPDLIIADWTYFQYFHDSQESLKRYTNTDKAKASFISLEYQTADVIFDGGSGIPDNHMYFVNTDYLELCEHKDARFTVMDEMRPHNQDAEVIPALWMGNLVCSNRELQGVLKA